MRTSPFAFTGTSPFRYARVPDRVLPSSSMCSESSRDEREANANERTDTITHIVDEEEQCVFGTQLYSFADEKIELTDLDDRDDGRRTGVRTTFLP